MSPASPYGPKADPGPPGFGAEAARLLRGAARRGRRGRDLGDPRRLRGAANTCRWTAQADFREALATTIAKSQDDRRVFELVFDRYFFRAAEASAIEQGIGERPSDERDQPGRPADDGDAAERLDSEQLRS